MSSHENKKALSLFYHIMIKWTKSFFIFMWRRVRFCGNSNLFSRQQCFSLSFEESFHQFYHCYLNIQLYLYHAQWLKQEYVGFLFLRLFLGFFFCFTFLPVLCTLHFFSTVIEREKSLE